MGCHPDGREPLTLRRLVASSNASHFLLSLILLSLLVACSAAPTFPAAAPSTGQRHAPIERDFRPADIVKSDIDETQRPGENPYDYASRLSQEKAAAVAPDDTLVWMNLGDNFVRLKDKPGARQAYQHVLDLNPPEELRATARKKLAGLHFDREVVQDFGRPAVARERKSEPFQLDYCFHFSNQF